MARTVTYSVVPRINPREKNDPPKYYAQAQARGDVSLREMAERIQSTCTVTKADVYAVLVSLEDVVKEAIQNGEIVRLGDLWQGDFAAAPGGVCGCRSSLWIHPPDGLLL